MADENANDFLYHYTSASALVGMLTTGEIWMSDPRFLNDSQEWFWAGKIVAKTIEAIAPTHKQAYLDRHCPPDRYDSFVHRLVTHFEKPPFHIPYVLRTMPFIFSLSKKRNSLSQWRAYGKGEYCIAFDRNQLASLSRVLLMDVDYSSPQPDSRIDQTIQDFFRSHVMHAHGTAEKPGGIDTEVFHEGAFEIQARLNKAHYFLSKKHPDFHEEEEVRLVQDVPIDPRFPQSSEIFFDGRSRYPIPRAKLKIFDLKRGEKSNRPKPNEIIKEIICGPGADRDRAAASLDMLNTRYQLGIRVSYSETPFRG